MVFQTVFLAGVVQAIFDADHRVTYSTNHALIGKARPSDTLESALQGRADRSVRVVDIAGERTKVLHTTVPVRTGTTTEPIGALSIAQDYRTIDLEIREAFQHAAVILGLALLVLWISLIPLPSGRRTSSTPATSSSPTRRVTSPSLRRSSKPPTRNHPDLVRWDVVTWNPGAERLRPARRRDCIGRKLPSSSRRPPRRAVFGGSDQRGEGVEDHERGPRKTGPVDAADGLADPDDAGRATSTAVISRDITHLKQQQAQLGDPRKGASRAPTPRPPSMHLPSRTTAAGARSLKDEFIALVSHELRTPLTSIRGYTELLLDGEAGELTDDQRQFLGVVERNSLRLLHLVGDLLFLAQVEAGKLVLDSRRSIEASACRSARGGGPGDDNQIELVADLAETPSMLGDRSRLAQVLDNLISNALKFTPTSGRVSVRVSRTGRNAVVEVADTGVGIPADEQDRLFERFFRSSNATEQAIPGTGLGLTIAKTIERHEGSIEIESAEGWAPRFASGFRSAPRSPRTSRREPEASWWSRTTIRTSCS
jgi:signal transduction histidine kinase